MRWYVSGRKWGGEEGELGPGSEAGLEQLNVHICDDQLSRPGSAGPFSSV